MEHEDIENLGDAFLKEVDDLTAKLKEERRYRDSYRPGRRVLRDITLAGGQPNGREHHIEMSPKTNAYRRTKGVT